VFWVCRTGATLWRPEGASIDAAGALTGRWTPCVASDRSMCASVLGIVAGRHRVTEILEKDRVAVPVRESDERSAVPSPPGPLTSTKDDIEHGQTISADAEVAHRKRAEGARQRAEGARQRAEGARQRADDQRRCRGRTPTKGRGSATKGRRSAPMPRSVTLSTRQWPSSGRSAIWIICSVNSYVSSHN